MRPGTLLACRDSWVHVHIRTAPLTLIHPFKWQTNKLNLQGGDAERCKTTPKALFLGRLPPGANQLPVLGGGTALARSQLGAGAHPN